MPGSYSFCALSGLDTPRRIGEGAVDWVSRINITLQRRYIALHQHHFSPRRSAYLFCYRLGRTRHYRILISFLLLGATVHGAWNGCMDGQVSVFGEGSLPDLVLIWGRLFSSGEHSIASTDTHCETSITGNGVAHICITWHGRVEQGVMLDCTDVDCILLSQSGC